jgi:hypothetical protein
LSKKEGWKIRESSSFSTTKKKKEKEREERDERTSINAVFSCIPFTKKNRMRAATATEMMIISARRPAHGR